MDGFLGYNQIKMEPEDMEKTTFVARGAHFAKSDAICAQEC